MRSARALVKNLNYNVHIPNLSSVHVSTINILSFFPSLSPTAAAAAPGASSTFRRVTINVSEILWTVGGAADD